jgi:hypothetical protein
MIALLCSDKIKASFPVMAAYAIKTDAFLRRYGYVTTALGRRRYVPEQTTVCTGGKCYYSGQCSRHALKWHSEIFTRT